MGVADKVAPPDLIHDNVSMAWSGSQTISSIVRVDAMLREGQEERLLSFLDGKTQIDHVLFMATTNYPERLDQRFRARPSRFESLSKNT
jgi:hypothetical protein